MYAQTKVVRQGIMLALSNGPATVAAIVERMGLEQSYTQMGRHMAQLEHDGFVSKAGKRQNPRGGPPAQAWTLTDSGRAVVQATERAA